MYAGKTSLNRPCTRFYGHRGYIGRAHAHVLLERLVSFHHANLTSHRSNLLGYKVNLPGYKTNLLGSMVKLDNSHANLLGYKVNLPGYKTNLLCSMSKLDDYKVNSTSLKSNYPDLRYKLVNSHTNLNIHIVDLEVIDLTHLKRKHRLIVRLTNKEALNRILGDSTNILDTLNLHIIVLEAYNLNHLGLVKNSLKLFKLNTLELFLYRGYLLLLVVLGISYIVLRLKLLLKESFIQILTFIPVLWYNISMKMAKTSSLSIIGRTGSFFFICFTFLHLTYSHFVGYHITLNLLNLKEVI
jgi:hypothetical protein